MKPGNIPKTKAICKNGFLNAKRSRDKTYATEIVKKVETIIEAIETIKVLMIQLPNGYCGLVKIPI